MMYSEKDIKEVSKQLWRRLALALVLLLIPNIGAWVLMMTVRIQWLSIALGILGGAAAIFYWGIWGYPVFAYLRYLKEIVGGRTHEFTGELTEIAQDSVREGVPCKTLFFCDDAGDEQRLCYFDLQRYQQDICEAGRKYHVTVHGQSIVAIAAE